MSWEGAPLKERDNFANSTASLVKNEVFLKPGKYKLCPRLEGDEKHVP